MKKQLKKYQKKGQVGNPYGKAFGADTDPYFKGKKDIARRAYIISDSLKNEVDKFNKSDYDAKTSKGYKRRGFNVTKSQEFKQLGDKIRKAQGYPTREMEWDYKKGGSTMKKYQVRGNVNEPKKPSARGLLVKKTVKTGDMANKMNPSIRDTSTTTRKGLIFKKKGGMVKSMKKK